MFKVILTKIHLKGRSLRLAFLEWLDYKRYAFKVDAFRRFDKKRSLDDKGSLLLLSGRGMNVLWAQVWTIFSIPMRLQGYRVFVLTTHAGWRINRYFALVGIKPIYFDELINKFPAVMPEDIKQAVQEAKSVPDYRRVSYKGIPIGEIALSTYTRYHGTGVIDLARKDVVDGLREWLMLLCQVGAIAEYVYDQYDVKSLFTAEIFFEEYGAFYYVALSKALNIIKFTGTVRDNAIILQHMTKSNDRQHHAALTQSTWKKVCQLPFGEKERAALTQNFADRYSSKWHRSKRNAMNTMIMPVEEARQILNIKQGRKVAVIYSHILYDSLYFFGTDLFEDYAQCLVETVRAACANTNVDWLVKVHPSNLWRGEMNSLLKGKYEEEQLINKAIGKLPAHVRIIAADTRINPYTWFQLADYGITVRGTAGLEMAAMGKIVVTAGTGRYEGNGFTIDPKDKAEYRETLQNIHRLPPLSPDQVMLAQRYAHALFVLKPFSLISLIPQLKAGVKKVLASDDLCYFPCRIEGDKLPRDLVVFSNWAKDVESLELINGLEDYSRDVPACMGN